MTRTVAGIVLGLLLLTWSAGAVAQTAEGEQFVNGQKGTYRGRILEAETGRPASLALHSKRVTIESSRSAGSSSSSCSASCP